MTMEETKEIRDLMRSIDDFPEPGIVFRDFLNYFN